MRVIIEKVSQGKNGIWNAEIDPQKLIKLASPVRQGGKLNVVMVSRPSYDASKKSLQFELDSAVLLNLGNTHEAVFLDSREAVLPETPAKGQLKKQSLPEGDRQFLDELKRLPEPQRKLGEQLLTTIRSEFPGELVLHTKSGKFVESPDNFWVIRVQPRAQSLRIIVYGRPEEHKQYDSIELKRDMASYSNFVIKSADQLSDAVSVIREAKRLKTLGKR